jgi:hypothetical protein
MEDYKLRDLRASHTLVGRGTGRPKDICCNVRFKIFFSFPLKLSEGLLNEIAREMVNFMQKWKDYGSLVFLALCYLLLVCNSGRRGHCCSLFVYCCAQDGGRFLDFP